MSIFSIFQRPTIAPVRDLGIISGSPFGDVLVDEWEDHLRFRVKESDVSVCFLRLEGDLLKLTSLFSNRYPNGYVKFALWALNDSEVRKMMNRKFGNNPVLKFTACQLYIEDLERHFLRGMVLLPTDTFESAMKRFEEVWYSQPRFANDDYDELGYRVNY